jgi:hypothetical protein
MESKIPQEWNKFYLKDVTFVNLMMRRVYNVLIVANPYDAFMLEDDGRVEEKIYNEYMEQPTCGASGICQIAKVSYMYNRYRQTADSEHPQGANLSAQQ